MFFELYGFHASCFEMVDGPDGVFFPFATVFMFIVADLMSNFYVDGVSHSRFGKSNCD